MPPRDFKSLTLRQVRTLLSAEPSGFAHDDLARRLGPDYASGGQSAPRLRHCVSAMCSAGILKRERRGRFVPGPNLDADQVLGAGVALADELRAAFYSAGGIMPMPEILAEVSREDDLKARLVRRVLRDSPAYFSGVPLDGFRTHWLMIESERRKVPLSGRWLLLDLQLTIAGSGSGHIPWDWGLEAPLAEYRKAIGFGLRRARVLLGVEPEDIVTDDAIASALDWCLGQRTDLHYLDSKSMISVSEWWTAVRKTMGVTDALGHAWGMLESPDAALPYILHTLDVRFWVAVGKRSGLDPAMLSRGALVHDDAGSFFR